MDTKNIFILVSLLFISVNSMAKGWPSKYAEKSVEQNHQNREMGCDFYSERWHSNFDEHKEWAKKVSKEVSKAEIKLRNIGLKSCQNAVDYANTAIEQGILNEEYKCYYKGARWHSNKSEHFKWAKGKNAYTIARETQTRRRLIDICRRQKNTD